MEFPNFFADAESSYKDADFVIFGVPFDKTSSFRHGSYKAPDSIRNASWNFETYNIKTKVDIKDINFHDYGNLDVESLNSKDMVDHVRDFTRKVLKDNKFPIAIGGEHSISIGAIQGFPKDTTVLSLDAHLDFRQMYENNIYNHACVTKRISEYIEISNIAILGVRSAEQEEYIDAKEKDLFMKDIYIIKETGFNKILNETDIYLKNKDIYLTLDIDVIDPAYAPGTATPEPFGLKPIDIFNCIDLYSSRLVGFDVVEVCPKYDNGQTSLLAAKIIRYIIERVWFNKLK
jgi:agmatinase